jgi:hypothetical protein
VDQAAADAAQQTYEPKHKQNHQNCPKHFRFPPEKCSSNELNFNFELTHDASNDHANFVEKPFIVQNLCVTE